MISVMVTITSILCTTLLRNNSALLAFSSNPLLMRFALINNNALKVLIDCCPGFNEGNHSTIAFNEMHYQNE